MPKGKRTAYNLVVDSTTSVGDGSAEHLHKLQSEGHAHTLKDYVAAKLKGTDPVTESDNEGQTVTPNVTTGQTSDQKIAALQTMVNTQANAIAQISQLLVKNKLIGFNAALGAAGVDATARKALKTVPVTIAKSKRINAMGKKKKSSSSSSAPALSSVAPPSSSITAGTSSPASSAPASSSATPASSSSVAASSSAPVVASSSAPASSSALSSVSSSGSSSATVPDSSSSDKVKHKSSSSS